MHIKIIVTFRDKLRFLLFIAGGCYLSSELVSGCERRTECINRAAHSLASASPPTTTDPLTLLALLELFARTETTEGLLVYTANLSMQVLKALYLSSPGLIMLLLLLGGAVAILVCFLRWWAKSAERMAGPPMDCIQACGKTMPGNNGPAKPSHPVWLVKIAPLLQSVTINESGLTAVSEWEQ